MKAYGYPILILFQNIKNIIVKFRLYISSGRYLLALLFLVLTFSGCKKWVDVGAPKTGVNSLNIYEKDATAISVLTGIYINLSKSGVLDGNALTSISCYGGLSSDELALTSYGFGNQVLSAYYTNSLNSQQNGHEFWDNIYSNLYIINAALEGISNSTTLSPTVKQQLIAEAKFMRAFYFFYLVNLFGDAPLMLTTDYKVNALMPRTPKKDIWNQIVIDLKDAQSSLSTEYLDAGLLKPTFEKLRPTKMAATSLLARVYLYMEQWQSAEESATRAIESPAYKLAELDEVFKKNNDEAIWQLQPVLNYYNTSEAIAFIITPDNNIPTLVLNQRLLNSFEQGDLRKNSWVKSIDLAGETLFFPYKYKVSQSATDPNPPLTEYSTVLRLAEQYLIRAEARIEQGKISEGVADLNILRNRATNKLYGTIHLPPLSLNLNRHDALMAVEHERQVELFTEWGHRWLDLKRTGRVDSVMKVEVPKKKVGAVWNSYQQLYPISLYELQHNPNMIQTSGY
jgi:hypothetical protein